MFDFQKERELFEAAAQDIRKRTEFLAKAVFLLSGGALTVSMGIFLGGEHPTKLPLALQPLLKSSWHALLYSMACYVLVIAIMIFRDYVAAENWRRVLHGKKRFFITHIPYYVADAILWTLGIGGLIYCFKGFAGLAKVSSSLLAVIN